MNWQFVRNVLLKALLLLAVFAAVLVFILPSLPLGRLSLYNHLFPGRPRFPFGENPQRSFNMTINDLDAMFASHVVTQPKVGDEFRVILVGDSSIWGTLLEPDETLAGRLNAAHLTACDGRKVVAYNLAYPTISLEKDVLVLDRAIAHQPDLILWGLTLEAFPGMNPSPSPLLAYNAKRLAQLLPGSAAVAAPRASFIDRLLAERRALADLYRHQLYGVLWAATGIDQDTVQSYESAGRDFEPDDTFNGHAPFDLAAELDYTPILKGFELAGSIPLILFNEPMLISTGANSAIRYNFFYPRWAYDAYRTALASQAASRGWHYLDLWDLVPENEFTNSAIHLTPTGEQLLADRLAEILQGVLGCP
jgi:hypothetical protein